MVSIPQRLTHKAFVLLVLAATSGSIRSQELKDRELRPAFDFNTIQMPLEIVSIRLNGKDVQPGEKIKGDDDWLQGLSFRLKNISDRPIAYLDIGLQFPQPDGIVVYSLNYGICRTEFQIHRGGVLGRHASLPLEVEGNTNSFSSEL